MGCNTCILRYNFINQDPQPISAQVGMMMGGQVGFAKKNVLLGNKVVISINIIKKKVQPRRNIGFES